MPEVVVAVEVHHVEAEVLTLAEVLEVLRAERVGLVHVVDRGLIRDAEAAAAEGDDQLVGERRREDAGVAHRGEPRGVLDVVGDLGEEPAGVLVAADRPREVHVQVVVRAEGDVDARVEAVRP